MAELISQFDRKEFLNQFTAALNQVDIAEKLGRDFAEIGINRIWFTGCGAPHYMMRLLAYWGHQAVLNTDIRVYHSSSLVFQDPAGLDEKTLVILGSHSGSTRETLEAAHYLQSRRCKTISITQEGSSPLGSTTEHLLAYGKTTQGYFSAFILAQVLFSAFLNQREGGWRLHAALMSSLPNLPAALAGAKEFAFEKAALQAKEVSTQNHLLVLGAGPMFTTAYVFAACFLMEMQWMQAHAINAADFFHGPFEVVDASTQSLILIGEDASRMEGERAKDFCAQYGGRNFIYDSREFEMQGIKTEVRPIVAPFILDSALTNLVEALAVIRDHPMATRRYMGKVAY